MTRCDYCGSRLVFGGIREGDLRFCNNQCKRPGILLASSRQVPDDIVREHVWRVHQGDCPKCHRRRGPVDVHTSYRVWSAAILTRWSSRPQISCRSCGRLSCLKDGLFCLLLGWWGVPWGIVLTPVQLVRNVAGLWSGPDPLQPSPQLEKLVRMNIAHVLQVDAAQGRA